MRAWPRKLIHQMTFALMRVLRHLPPLTPHAKGIPQPCSQPPSLPRPILRPHLVVICLGFGPACVHPLVTVQFLTFVKNCVTISANFSPANVTLCSIFRNFRDAGGATSFTCTPAPPPPLLTPMAMEMKMDRPPTQRWSTILVATTFALLSKWITAPFCGMGTSACVAKIVLMTLPPITRA